MRLLLDTQIAQWAALRRDKLNRQELRILESQRNQFVISAVSLWEMRVKWQSTYRSGDRKGDAEPGHVVELLSDAGFSYQPLPLTFEHCIAVLAEPFDHDDPFDRFLLAQAQVEGLRLLTRDHKFTGHPLALIA